MGHTELHCTCHMYIHVYTYMYIITREGAAHVSTSPMHQWARGGDASAAVNRGVRVLPIAKRFVLLNLFSAGTVELLCGGAI